MCAVAAVVILDKSYKEVTKCEISYLLNGWYRDAWLEISSLVNVWFREAR